MVENTILTLYTSCLIITYKTNILIFRNKINLAKSEVQRGMAQLHEVYSVKMATFRNAVASSGQQLSYKMAEAGATFNFHAACVGKKMSEIYNTHVQPHVVKMREYINSIYTSHVEPIVSSERVRRAMSIASSEYVTPASEMIQGVVTKYNQALIKMKDAWRKIERTEQYQQIKDWALVSLEHVNI